MKINVNELESHCGNIVRLAFTNVNKQKQQQQQKYICIQSVAYGSCLSPLLSGEDMMSLSPPLSSESSKLHSESVSFYVIKADLYLYVIWDYAQIPTDMYVYGLDRRP